MGCSDGDCDGWTFAYNGNHRGPYKCYLKVGLPPQSDWQTDPNVISGWSATPEITTELLAAEVVNTTTAGFTTGGLAEKHCNGVFCPGVGAVEAALAAEEIT